MSRVSEAFNYANGDSRSLAQGHFASAHPHRLHSSFSSGPQFAPAAENRADWSRLRGPIGGGDGVAPALREALRNIERDFHAGNAERALHALFTVLEKPQSTLKLVGRELWTAVDLALRVQTHRLLLKQVVDAALRARDAFDWACQRTLIQAQSSLSKNQTPLPYLPSAPNGVRISQNSFDEQKKRPIESPTPLSKSVKRTRWDAGAPTPPPPSFIPVAPAPPAFAAAASSSSSSGAVSSLPPPPSTAHAHPHAQPRPGPGLGSDPGSSNPYQRTFPPQNGIFPRPPSNGASYRPNGFFGQSSFVPASLPPPPSLVPAFNANHTNTSNPIYPYRAPTPRPHPHSSMGPGQHGAPSNAPFYPPSLVSPPNAFDQRPLSQGRNGPPPTSYPPPSVSSVAEEFSPSVVQQISAMASSLQRNVEFELAAHKLGAQQLQQARPPVSQQILAPQFQQQPIHHHQQQQQRPPFMPNPTATAPLPPSSVYHRNVVSEPSNSASTQSLLTQVTVPPAFSLPLSEPAPSSFDDEQLPRHDNGDHSPITPTRTAEGSMERSPVSDASRGTSSSSRRRSPSPRPSRRGDMHTRTQGGRARDDESKNRPVGSSHSRARDRFYDEDKYREQDRSSRGRPVSRSPPRRHNSGSGLSRRDSDVRDKDKHNTNNYKNDKNDKNDTIKNNYNDRRVKSHPFESPSSKMADRRDRPVVSDSPSNTLKKDEKRSTSTTTDTQANSRSREVEVAAVPVPAPVAPTMEPAALTSQQPQQAEESDDEDSFFLGMDLSAVVPPAQELSGCTQDSEKILESSSVPNNKTGMDDLQQQQNSVVAATDEKLSETLGLQSRIHDTVVEGIEHQYEFFEEMEVCDPSSHMKPSVVHAAEAKPSEEQQEEEDVSYSPTSHESSDSSDDLIYCGSTSSVPTPECAPVSALQSVPVPVDDPKPTESIDALSLPVSLPIPPPSSLSPHVHRLSLVLDLDNTLIHASKDDKALPTVSTSEVDSIQWEYQGGEFKMLIKQRPGLQTFLAEASSMYDLFLYTAGHQDYAQKACRIIDPKGEYFGSRLVACEDVDKRLSSDKKTLKRIVDQSKWSQVLVVDDTEEVWSEHADNLILSRKYFYFYEARDKDKEVACGEEDRQLLALISVLKRVYNSYISSAPSPDQRDVTKILQQIRKSILAGVKFAVTLLFGQNINPECSSLYAMATAMGAKFTRELTPDTSHLITPPQVSKLNLSDKLHIARKHFPHISIVSFHWIHHAFFYWQRPTESQFTTEFTGGPIPV